MNSFINKTKKIVGIVLLSILTISFSSCGDKKNKTIVVSEKLKNDRKDAFSIINDEAMDGQSVLERLDDNSKGNNRYALASFVAIHNFIRKTEMFDKEVDKNSLTFNQKANHEHNISKKDYFLKEESHKDGEEKKDGKHYVDQFENSSVKYIAQKINNLDSGLNLLSYLNENIANKTILKSLLTKVKNEIRDDIDGKNEKKQLEECKAKLKELTK